tara:strand:+ start:2867 stop:3103 length:237 start_codon:yes stop_codon:yes gene_type:complete
MVRTKNSINKNNHWKFIKLDDKGEIINEEEFKTLKDIAVYLDLTIASVKNFTSVKRKCKQGKKKTKMRWEGIKLEKLF